MVICDDRLFDKKPLRFVALRAGQRGGTAMSMAILSHMASEAMCIPRPLLDVHSQSSMKEIEEKVRSTV